MAALVPAASENRLLLILNSIAETYHILLFQNDFTPDDTTVLTDLTEADFNGYTAGGQNLVESMSIFQNGDNKAEQDFLEVSWTKAAGGTGNTIYGYMILDVTTAMLAVERFATPVDMNTDGSILNLDPAITLSQDPPS